MTSPYLPPSIPGARRRARRLLVLLGLLLSVAASAQPTITGLSPTRNLRNAVRTSSVAVAFSQTMSTSAATAGAVKVFSQQRGGRMSDGQSGTATVSGNAITFNSTTQMCTF